MNKSNCVRIVQIGVLAVFFFGACQGFVPLRQTLYRVTGVCVVAYIVGAALYDYAYVPCPFFASQWTVDNRHITESWPRETVKWLRKYEVNGDLKTKLDNMFRDKEVAALLSQLYTWRRDFNPYYHAIPYSAMCKLEERYNKVKDQLCNKGFGFYIPGGSFNTRIAYASTIVFTHNNMPGYILKMSTDEIRNIGRIKGAEYLRAKLAAKVILPEACTDINKTYGVSVSKKSAYITPFSASYKDLPKVIVVAECIDYEWPLNQKQVCQLKKGMGLYSKEPIIHRDVSESNVVIKGDTIVFLDTENIENVPGFSKITPKSIPLEVANNGGVDITFREGWGSDLRFNSLFHEGAILPSHNGLVSYRMRNPFRKKDYEQRMAPGDCVEWIAKKRAVYRVDENE